MGVDKWLLKSLSGSIQGLSSNNFLVHYDLNRNLRRACDASSYGLGAVLSYVMDDGQERPIRERLVLA